MVYFRSSTFPRARKYIDATRDSVQHVTPVALYVHDTHHSLGNSRACYWTGRCSYGAIHRRIRAVMDLIARLQEMSVACLAVAESGGFGKHGILLPHPHSTDTILCSGLLVLLYVVSTLYFGIGPCMGTIWIVGAVSRNAPRDQAAAGRGFYFNSGELQRYHIRLQTDPDRQPGGNEGEHSMRA